jgi:hypothetical protein
MDDRSGTVPQPPRERPGREGRSGASEAETAIDAAPTPQPVLVRPVVHIHSPILDAGARPPSPASHLDLPALVDVARGIWPNISPVVAVGGVFLFFTNSYWAVFAAGMTAAVMAMRAVARRVTFTFAEGFLAYRRNDAWPLGVQEEYDIPFTWPSSGRFAGNGTPRTV